MRSEKAAHRAWAGSPRLSVWARATKIIARQWMADDGLVWLHLLKTVSAALLAMGIAMLLQLSSPRTAMTTVFVLMQPLSGMVLAKSFYRVVGTATGMIAALVLGGIFAQQPELYMLGITLWIGACTAAAVRYRHFRWYAFVLAGYTAALIGIPTVMAPNGLFLAALTRAAEVMIGILCSSAISALVLPLHSSTALKHTLRTRYTNFSAFAASVLTGQVADDVFETRFADLVDQIVGFEAVRSFASFEDPNMRVRSRRLARLNSEFMNACTRLHALHQLVKRMNAGHAKAVVEAASPYFRELSGLLDKHKDPMKTDELSAASAAVELGRFQSTLPQRVGETRRSFEMSVPEHLLDFDTTMELLYRFVDEFLRYTQAYASLADEIRRQDQRLRRRIHVRAYCRGRCRCWGILDRDCMAERRPCRDRGRDNVRPLFGLACPIEIRRSNGGRHGTRGRGGLCGHVLCVSEHRGLCLAVRGPCAPAGLRRIPLDTSQHVRLWRRLLRVLLPACRA